MARNVGFCVSWKTFTLGALLPLLYYDRYTSCYTMFTAMRPQSRTVAVTRTLFPIRSRTTTA